LDKSESRDGDRRIYFATPLAILFRIDEGIKTAVVMNAWLIRSRKKP